MNAQEILDELKTLGSDSTKRTLLRHGARKPLFGVKVGDLQKIRKRVGVDHQLALDLYASGNYDAMYLAGLIADDARMTKPQLRKWAKQGYGGSLPGFTVPRVATGSKHGYDLALEWIESKQEMIAAIGWSTLASIATVQPDDQLNLAHWKKLLQRVEKEIHQAPNEVRYAMNGFVTATGCCIAPLFETALATADRIGEVIVDHGETSCKTPSASDMIRKVEKMGRVGKKKKQAKC